jgi:hypothetical protein
MWASKESSPPYCQAWPAGIREYWLVDVRGDREQFDILRYTSRGYVPVPKKGGWPKSAVLGKSFRLRVGTNRFGHPAYALEVRQALHISPSPSEFVFYTSMSAN